MTCQPQWIFWQDHTVQKATGGLGWLLGFRLSILGLFVQRSLPKAPSAVVFGVLSVYLL